VLVRFQHRGELRDRRLEVLGFDSASFCRRCFCTIAGGLFVLFAHGAGAWAIDALWKRHKLG
jgi:hypothetical protein